MYNVCNLIIYHSIRYNLLYYMVYLVGIHDKLVYHSITYTLYIDILYIWLYRVLYTMIITYNSYYIIIIM